ncbi:hypothetical protein CI102_11602 [Trichoderma harzianum]|uniref:Uncharacterized protein n=1 Tax=Trichoderma harzianum CBS 226.95 TaxID=983964 RepID=A0A2T4A6W1_TRIHA|nr:hypothetical protein M431DRAFT_471321 [Trichoderma harzianum CBS 226.95]PKK45121.1 hypothetical protein CI102_11602 [Trichoderma harzianum]PTB52758.1 hypothetical protein M431DRAFT_471321 [Trichoderma harzianum CBS 226.95]
MQVAQNRGDQRTRAHRRSSGFLGLDQSVNITQCQGVCDRDAEILARGLHPVGQPCHETSLFKPKGGESPYNHVTGTLICPLGQYRQSTGPAIAAVAMRKGGWKSFFALLRATNSQGCQVIIATSKSPGCSLHRTHLLSQRTEPGFFSLTCLRCHQNKPNVVKHGSQSAFGSFYSLKAGFHPSFVSAEHARSLCPSQ